MALRRMDNVLIVVDDLEATKAFFIELGLKLEGETTVQGAFDRRLPPKAFFIELGLQLEGETTGEAPGGGKLVGVGDVGATLAMLRTPDGQGIELDKFHTPGAIRFGPVDAPVNTLGIRRIMFAVDCLDALVARMRAHGGAPIRAIQY